MRGTDVNYFGKDGMSSLSGNVRRNDPKDLLTELLAFWNVI